MSSTQLYTQNSMDRRSRSRSRSVARSTRKRSRSAGRTSGYKSNARNMTGQIMIPRGGLGGNTFVFSRICTLGDVFNTIDGTAAGAIVSAVNPHVVNQQFFTLDLLPNYTDFTNLFSQYRVKELTYHLINCNFTEVEIAQGTGLTLGTNARNLCVYLGKQNDVLTPTTLAQVQSEEGVIMRDYANDGKPFIVKIKAPTYFVPAVDSTATLVQAQESSGWLDCTADDIAYRGFFALVEQAFGSFGGATLQRVFTQRVQVTLEFRGVR